MFDLSLRLADHVRRYSVSTVASGWEVTLEEDSSVRRREQYHDWHRVERALAMFQIEVDQLTAHGWLIEPCEG